MPGRAYLVVLLIALLPGPAFAAPEAEPPPGEASPAHILYVGPTRKLKLPSAAAAVAQPGDIIRIDAGTYRDCAVWRVGNISIHGVGGPVEITDTVCPGNAIWLFQGAPVRVGNVRFSGAHARDGSAAAIRWYGGGLLVVGHSTFIDNQTGIATDDARRARVHIEYSRFEKNGGCRAPCGSGIDVGRIARLSVFDSVFTGQQREPNIRSRAAATEITRTRIIDGPTGTGRTAVDLPDGGTVTLHYNYFEKGVSADPAAVISIGEDIAKGAKANPSTSILIESNEFQNNNRVPTVFVRNFTTQRATLRSNRIGGPGTLYR